MPFLVLPIYLPQSVLGQGTTRGTGHDGPENEIDQEPGTGAHHEQREHQAHGTGVVAGRLGDVSGDTCDLLVGVRTNECHHFFLSLVFLFPGERPRRIINPSEPATSSTPANNVFMGITNP